MNFHELTHQQQLDVVIDLHQQRDHLERENAKQAEMLNKVIEQRDDLLAAAQPALEALEDLTPSGTMPSFGVVKRELRAAIAKVKP